MRLVFDSPAHHVLQFKGNEIHGGEEFDASKSEYEDLVRASVNVHPPKEEAPDLHSMNRPELEEIAATEGVQNPSSFSSKKELVEAIESQRTTP